MKIEKHLYDPASLQVFTFNGRSKDSTVFDARICLPHNFPKPRNQRRKAPGNDRLWQGIALRFWPSENSRPSRRRIDTLRFQQ